jgi:hypothetical protein
MFPAAGASGVGPLGPNGRRRDHVPERPGAAPQVGLRHAPATTARPALAQSSSLSALMNASWGTSTRPMFFIRFLPSFWRSSSLRFRVMSPP